MLRRIQVVAILMLTGLLAALPVYAGDVQGRIWVANSGGNTFAAGAKILLSCESMNGEGTANQKGSYRIDNAGTGSCSIVVNYQGKESNRINLFVSNETTRADLELRSNQNESWSVTLK